MKIPLCSETNSVAKSKPTMASMTSKLITQIRYGIVGAVEIILDDEVVELIQCILSLVSLGAELLHQPLETVVVNHATSLSLVQQSLREHQVTLYLPAIEAELSASNIRPHKLIGKQSQHAVDEPGGEANRRLHLLWGWGGQGKSV